eukprot:CAMPEP_0175187636 /NCGR_PEP_ID=MMETSP0093-20121207/3011_1 /TAXON_ID=311494 /ORGANISM="Alexandrium monilatum, Strain CCMP3105" /LENGTH=407 /DNA_ID=CAMNT_0016480399 /DNA_START=85 /DNA_END=1308 /DNA_ORIENTATION=-
MITPSHLAAAFAAGWQQPRKTSRDVSVSEKKLAAELPAGLCVHMSHSEQMQDLMTLVCSVHDCLRETQRVAPHVWRQLLIMYLVRLKAKRMRTGLEEALPPNTLHLLWTLLRRVPLEGQANRLALQAAGPVCSAAMFPDMREAVDRIFELMRLSDHGHAEYVNGLCDYLAAAFVPLVGFGGFQSTLDAQPSASSNWASSRSNVYSGGAQWGSQPGVSDIAAVLNQARHSPCLGQGDSQVSSLQQAPAAFPGGGPPFSSMQQAPAAFQPQVPQAHTPVQCPSLQISSHPVQAFPHSEMMAVQVPGTNTQAARSLPAMMGQPGRPADTSMRPSSGWNAPGYWQDTPGPLSPGVHWDGQWSCPQPQAMEEFTRPQTASFQYGRNLEEESLSTQHIPWGKQDPVEFAPRTL